MADSEKATSADAEVPDNVTQNDEAAAEGTPAGADVPEESAAAAEAAAEPVAEAEPEAAVEPDAAAEPEAPGTSAEAEVPPTGPKPKKKRLPRAERPARSKPRRDKPATRKPIVRLEKPEHERGRRQERQGTVVSDAMDKTIVVKVEVVKAHPKYKKVVRRSVKFHAHDERSEAKVGDVVRIVETRPLSKTKHWRLAEVVEAAK
jgi:small subunit ribosomal protein S17